MCGRYQFSRPADGNLLQAMQELSRQTGEPIPEGDICPGGFAPVLLADGVCRMRWGYPSPFGKGLIINARAESAARKPTFREAVRRRRCALPAAGFYEWDAQGSRYRFCLPGEQTLYMAGLWDIFQGERRFVILTTVPNASVRDIHDRMPVLLAGERLTLWLREAEKAPALLGQTPPDCIRTPEEGAQQLSFF